jgi:cyclopropane fatty-acyl-phospholipid synthase-like methyltransferase
MDSHYTQIFSNYDYFYEPIYQGLVPIIINKLQLTPDDLLLDIGAATGKLA